MKKKLLVIASIAGALACAAWFIFFNKTDETISFETEKISRGDISTVVTATGTVQPVDKVEVGTQVSGVIQSIFVDFNSDVKKGQLLAELDKQNLNARLSQASASLDVAKNELDFQKLNHARIEKLFNSKSVSKAEYENAVYALNRAKSNYQMAASEVQQAKVNLNFSMIYSPVDGTVLNRAVEEGQTVAASLNAPILFTIARDLKKMQVEASVDEADIGQVKKGQPVTFSVDAFPNEEFSGTVKEVRLEPVITSNVVTYTVIIEAPNPDLMLMPGLTATISITTKEQKDVLLLNLRAMRYNPDPEIIAQVNGLSPGSETVKEAESGNLRRGRRGQEPSVWLKTANGLEKKTFKTGMSDGSFIVVEEGLEEGTEVVSGVTIGGQKSDGGAQRSPFMPGRRK